MMDKWLREWGKPPKRKVRHFLWPPTLILRQLLSAFYLGALTQWKNLPYWIAHYGFKCLPGAAGSKGMGCIGFPSHPVWEMTAACNLNCIHCHASGGKPSEDELSTTEAKQLLDQLVEIEDFRMMAFTGGEPLVRPDLFEILAYSRELGFVNTIATNATLINDSVARRLKSHGVAIAAVSLDGLDAKTHDMVRGVEGSFDAAIEGMRALRRANILLQVNITAMEYNLRQVEPMMRLIDELDTGILLMYQLVPVGRGQEIEESALDLGANEKLIRFMAHSQRDIKTIMEPVAGPQYWPFLLQRKGITGGLALKLAEKVFHGCSAGRGFVYVKPNGEVWPCPFIEVNCGNIRLNEFKEIWETSRVFRNLRERESRLKGQCRDCEYRKLCGGCRGRAWSTTGDYLAEDPSCFIHKQDEEKQLHEPL
jgi:radical SAM protein with 4Fe4S-binding SPASM domain